MSPQPSSFAPLRGSATPGGFRSTESRLPDLPGDLRKETGCRYAHRPFHHKKTKSVFRNRAASRRICAIGPPTGPKKLRCEFCRAVGHSVAECRKKKRSCTPQDAPANRMPASAITSSTLRCYGGQRPGFMRRNCPTCNPSISADRPVGFYSLNLVEPSTARHHPAVVICAIRM